jgi:hypothetical protein
LCTADWVVLTLDNCKTFIIISAIRRHFELIRHWGKQLPILGLFLLKTDNIKPLTLLSEPKLALTAKNTLVA